MTLERRTTALLDLVEADRAARCGAILAEAQGRAAAIRAAAHAEARAKVRRAFDEERGRREARIAAARAKLQTHVRLHDQRRAGALLGNGWQRLPNALRERWDQPATRAAWVARVVDEALRALPRTAWRIVHANPWPEGERFALAAALAADLDAAPQFVADESLGAGLRIASGGNTIDGTLAGLFADRADVGASLLHRLQDDASRNEDHSEANA